MINTLSPPIPYAWHIERWQNLRDHVVQTSFSRYQVFRNFELRNKWQMEDESTFAECHIGGESYQIVKERR